MDSTLNPVCAAARSGDAVKLKQLLEEGYDYSAHIISIPEQIPLKVAAIKGHLECVKLILDAARKDFSTNEEILRCIAGPGGTPLRWATRRGNSEVLAVLTDLYPMASAEETGYALHKACRHDCTECINVFLKRFPHIMNEPDTFGDYAFGMVIRHDKHAAIKLFLDSGVNFHSVSKMGSTTLHSACLSGNIELVHMLIGEGLDVNAQDKRGFTPIHRAAWNGSEEVVKLLLSCAADPSILTFDSSDRVASALSAAAEKGNLEVTKLLAEVTPFELRTEAVKQAAFGAWDDCLEYLLTKRFPAIESLTEAEDEETWINILRGTRQYGAQFYPGRVNFGSSKTVKLLLENGTHFDRFGREREAVLLLNGLVTQNYINHIQTFLDFGLMELRYGVYFNHNLVSSIKSLMEVHAKVESGDEEDEEGVGLVVEEEEEEEDVIERLDYQSKLALYVSYYPFGKCLETNPLSPRTNLDFVRDCLIHSVPTLTELCRWNIRCCIVREHHHVLPKHIAALGLPRQLDEILLVRPEKR